MPLIHSRIGMESLFVLTLRRCQGCSVTTLTLWPLCTKDVPSSQNKRAAERACGGTTYSTGACAWSRGSHAFSTDRMMPDKIAPDFQGSATLQRILEGKCG